MRQATAVARVVDNQEQLAPRQKRRKPDPVIATVQIINPLTRRALQTAERMGSTFAVEWDGLTLTIRAVSK